MSLRALIAVSSLLLASACSDPSTPVGDVSVTDTTGTNDASGGTDGSTDTASDTTGGGQLTGQACPRVDLGNTVPATFSGSTVGLPNVVTSSRLEWEDAPDDALRFTAPKDGDYYVTFTGTNPAMGPSASKYTGTSTIQEFFTPSDCPAPGAVVEVDGWFDGDLDYPWTMTAGETILIWVGVPYWGQEETGDYTITVDLVP